MSDLEDNILNGDVAASMDNIVYDDMLAEHISEVFERDSRRYSRALTDEQEAKIL